MKIYPYGHNYLLSETEGNFKKTYELITNTQSTFDRIGLLKPLVLIQANIIKPHSASYCSKYLIYDNCKRISLNATRKEVAYEKHFIVVLRKLETSILNVYDEDTNEFKSIFVKGISC